MSGGRVSDMIIPTHHGVAVAALPPFGGNDICTLTGSALWLPLLSRALWEVARSRKFLRHLNSLSESFRTGQCVRSCSGPLKAGSRELACTVCKWAV